jgi:SET domain-containing protein
MAMRRTSYRIGRSATGFGLFATEPIAKGAFIVEYSGPLIPTKEAQAREARTGCRYMFEINNRWTVDGSGRRNIGRYANHSCRPNAESALSKGKVILRAIKTIKPGEEITYDYGREYFELFIKPKGCRCVKCAGVATRPTCARGRSAERLRRSRGGPSRTSAP